MAVQIESVESEHVQLPEAPCITGLRFRRFRGPADYPALVQLMNACAEYDRMDYRMSEQDMATFWAPSHRFEPGEDVVIAEVDGAAIATGFAFRPQQNGEELYYALNGRVLPEWRRRGIGRALRLNTERHLRELHLASRDLRPASFLSYSRDGVIPAECHLTKAGYEPARHYYYMLRRNLHDVGSTRLPDGIEVRPVRADQLRAVYEAEIEAFRDHWGPTEYPFEFLEREAALPGCGPAMWVVAWQGDQIVGMVRNRIDAAENEAMHRLRGYNDQVSVRRPWRGRGIARALLNRSLILLRELGMTESTLRVDTQNPTGALRLYEGCGFAVDYSETEYRKRFA